MLRENHTNFCTIKKQLTTKQNIRENFVLCNLLQIMIFLILAKPFVNFSPIFFISQEAKMDVRKIFTQNE